LEYSQTRNRYGHNGKAMVSGESDGVAMGKWLWANRVVANMWGHIECWRHKSEWW
jgi:hypothetical protein